MQELLTSKPLVDLALDAIQPSPLNPRKSFAGIEDLAADIQLFGVQQPIMVRPGIERDTFEIIMGERRWRACQMLGLAVIPAMVMEATDCDLVERALSENLSRQDLSCIETAEGFQTLLTLNRALTHESLATRHRLPGGATRVSNLLRLLKLPQEVRDQLAAGTLTEGHGTALCGLDGQPDYQKALASQVLDDGMTVAELREKVRIKAAFLKEREQTVSLPLDVPAPAPAPATGSSSSVPDPRPTVPDVKSNVTPAQATREFEASQQPDPDVIPLSQRPAVDLPAAEGGRKLLEDLRKEPIWLESSVLDLLPRVRLMPAYANISIDEVASMLITERAAQLGIVPFAPPATTTRVVMGDIQREKELADEAAELPTIRVYPALETMQPETQEAIGNMVTAVIDAANRGELPKPYVEEDEDEDEDESEDEDEPIFMTSGAEFGGSHASFIAFWIALKAAKAKRLHSLKFSDQAEIERSANYLLTGIESRKPTLTTERYRKALEALAIYTEAYTQGETYNWAGVTDTSPMMRRFKNAQLDLGSQGNG